MGSCISSQSTSNDWVYNHDKKLYINGTTVSHEIYHTTSRNPIKNNLNTLSNNKNNVVLKEKVD